MKWRFGFAFCLVAALPTIIGAQTLESGMGAPPGGEIPQMAAPPPGSPIPDLPETAAPHTAPEARPSTAAPALPPSPAAAPISSTPEVAPETSSAGASSAEQGSGTAVQSTPTAQPSETAPSLSQSQRSGEASDTLSASSESLAQSSPSVAAPSASPEHLPRNLSPWRMFEQADVVVKTVMIGLAIASFVTWTVWFAKAVELMSAKCRLRRVVREIASSNDFGGAVETMSRARGPGPSLVRAAAEELISSKNLLDNVHDMHSLNEGIKERVISRLSRVEAAAARRMAFGTGVLATIGAVAPFVGLFGTVWGIMNAFIGISEAQTTNLAVVAPGIAEALLATALGLVAAIPAVIIYNVFARSIAGYRLLLADVSAVVERLVSRELDLRRLSPVGASRPLAFVRAAE